MNPGDLPGLIAAAAVAAGLVATAAVQVRPLRHGRALLDLVALVPEWRFYAQASIREAADIGRDTHLVIRDRDAHGQAGGWQPLLSPPERSWAHALWNPRRRVDDPILSHADDLAYVAAGHPAPDVQQSFLYLIVLRAALAPYIAPGIERQFAVVRTLGRTTPRGARTLSLDFVSAWHSC